MSTTLIVVAFILLLSISGRVYRFERRVKDLETLVALQQSAIQELAKAAITSATTTNRLARSQVALLEQVEELTGEHDEKDIEFN